MLAIKNNLMAGNAARHLGKAYAGLSQSVERLSSGLRINSAKDDAAGMAVRELMRAEIAVLRQGSRNAQDGISMLQTMEGALAVIDENLIRMKELAEQAATGSYSVAQRQIMNAEFGEMAAEIDRIVHATKFNDIAMLNTDIGQVSIHVGTEGTIDIDKVDMTSVGLDIATGTGGWEVVSDTANGVASASDTWLTIADGADDLTITFTNSTGTDEQAISVNLGVGDHSLAQVVSEINQASQGLGFDTDGTNLAYDAAAAVFDEATGTYNLQLISRDGDADGMTVTLGASATASGGLTGNGDVSADFQAGSEQAGLNILSESAAMSALDIVGQAIETKDQARAMFGYKMNRLESTTDILNIQSENLMAAESRISDVDVATEMAVLTRTQVLAQAGVSMLSQANTMPQMALSLLR